VDFIVAHTKNFLQRATVDECITDREIGYAEWQKAQGDDCGCARS
jgi:hypothetical protein